ncbi:MAG: hypothetical protein KGZ93_02535 [Actinobacteria bacterium]|nr:hypothetical protein [Actinomycetota bacterium]
MNNTPEAVLSHAIPGRLRIKVPSRKGDAKYFSSLKSGLSELPGVERLEVSPVTASVLVIYTQDFKGLDEHASSQHLFSLSRPGKLNSLGQGTGSIPDGRLFDTENSATSTTTPMRQIFKSYEGANAKTKSATGGELDVATIVSLSLLGVGFYQIFRGGFVLPSWHTAFWYALNIINIVRARR